MIFESFEGFERYRFWRCHKHISFLSYRIKMLRKDLFYNIFVIDVEHNTDCVSLLES